MNKISSRQLYFFLAAVAPVGKLLLLPTTLAHYAKNDLLFPALANYVLQAVAIFLVLLASRKNRSLYELLQGTFGKVTAKILIALFSLFLFFCAFLPIQEHRLFVQTVLYDTLPSLAIFSVFFLFSAYLCAKPLFSEGRMCDILAPLSIAGYLGILALSLRSADFGELLPVGAGGGFLEGAAYSLCWFYDSAILLVLMGKFEYKKGMAWKGALSYLAGGAAVLFFLALFYGVYGEIAVYQTFAFAKISKYFPGTAILGRIDYLFVLLLTVVMAYYCALPVQAGVDCLCRCFGDNKLLPALFSVGANLVLFVLTALFRNSFVSVLNTVGKTLFWVFPAFCLLVPLIALFFRRPYEAE